MSEFPRLWPEDELPDELRPSRGKGALEALLEQPLTFDAPAQAPQVPQEPAERRTIRRMLAERAPQAQPVQAVQTPQTPQQGEGAFARVVASPLTFGTEQQPEDDDPTGYGAPGASLRWVQPPLDFGTGGIVSTVPEAQTQRRSIRRMLAERTGQPEQPPVYAPPANPPEAAPPPQPLGPLFGGNVGEALRRVTQGTAEALGFGRRRGERLRHPKRRRSTRRPRLRQRQSTLRQCRLRRSSRVMPVSRCARWGKARPRRLASARRCRRGACSSRRKHRHNPSQSRRCAGR